MLALFLLACSDGTPIDTAGPGAEEECAAVVIEASLPEDGATNFYYRQAVEFTLSDEVESADIVLVNADGALVAGVTTTESDGERVVFTPDAPLTLGASYTATLTVCGSDVVRTFTVSTAYGNPREAEIDGAAYLMHPTWGRIIEPEGGSLIVNMLAPEPFLFQGTGSGTVDIRMGFSSDEVQDVCLPTFDLPSADFTEDPWIHFGPAPAALAVPSGEIVDLVTMEFDGTFSPDLATVGGIRLSWEVDMRTLPTSLAEGLGTDDPCSLLVTVGASCQACTTDGEPNCLVMRFDQITAVRADGVAVEEIAEANCHPGCDASADNPECEMDW